MNIYLFISGIFLVLLSVAHALFGELSVYNVVMESNLSRLLITSVYVPWHQISSFILVMVIGNFLTFLFISIARRDWVALQQSVFQIAVFVILIATMAVGIYSIKKHAH
jgi:hypothetical protein